MQSTRRPPPPPPTARRAHPLSSAGRIRALHLEFQRHPTSLFLSSTLALRRRQGETLLSTKLLAPGKPGLFTAGPTLLQRDESETNVLYLLLGLSSMMMQVDCDVTSSLLF